MDTGTVCTMEKSVVSWGMEREQIHILHHGGAAGVTGSCHQLFWADRHSILIDCGLFQGDEEQESPEITFPISSVQALVLTHVHIDHCGRIPYLMAAGFSGPIYCSEPSALLLPEMLADAFSLGISRSKRLREEFLGKLKRMLYPIPYRQWQAIGPEGTDQLRIRLHEAGHILGSAFVECAVLSERIIFSGDLGAPYSPLLKAPASPWGCDRLVLESTYGDTVHAGRAGRRGELAACINKAAENRGVILIPAFSMGRTQELLYELEELTHNHRIDMEIVVDSPLAARFTELYRQLSTYWDAEAKRRVRRGRHPLRFEELYTVSDHRTHLDTVAYLKRTARPTVVIAASGMCTGGRIVDYLKALIGDPRTDILFAGYQAAGTPGRAIQQYGPVNGWVRLDGQKYTIAAGVRTISGYSAHADRQNLLNFVRRMRKRPREIHIVHGERDARQALAGQLEGEFPEIHISWEWP